MAMLASQGIGFVITVLVLLVSGEPAAPPVSLGWAAFAGVSGIAGLAFFYFALSRGTMGLVAPLAALVGAGLPVLLAIVEGETPDATRLAGITVALVAVVLISLPPRGQDAAVARMELRELPIVLLSGLGFAGFFIAIDRASEGGALWWPLATVRLFGITMVIAAIAFFAWRSRAGSVRQRLGGAIGLDRFRSAGRTVLGTLPLFLIAGAGDMGGNFFFVQARGADDLSVAVVLSSLYPIVTTILAAIFLSERLRAVQIAGVVLAALSVPLLR
jgi:drug/metabolite transporter (DMT)-like permease